MTCKKCKGFMIEERQPDLSPGQVIYRCVNCGLVIDQLIVQNRLQQLRERRSLPRAA
ncbi:MAG: hypothetical protein NNA23_09595 [Nitrospira sp.]|nr:hypothetical protein [Nitrospira sp.]MCP9463939.1 hypothetical protein [Nitrospira sp.]